MLGIDLVAHVLRLVHIRGSAFRELILGDAAEWGPDEENRALLLEVQHYQLELGWVDRITDPDDPELKRERMQAKRQGITPPKHPVVPPAAMRPGELAEQRLKTYIDELAALQPQKVKTRVSRSEWERAMGLT